MGLWARTGRLSKALLLITAGAAGGGAAIAVASVPDSNGVIHACYAVNPDGSPNTSAANLTVIDPSAGQSCSPPGTPSAGPSPRRQLDWNIQGPSGASGAQGPPGPQGPPGSTSKIQSAGGITLPTPSGGNGGPDDKAVLGSGRGALSIPIQSVVLLAPQTGGGGSNQAAKKVVFKPFSITRKIDLSSPRLFQLSATGHRFKTVTVTMSKEGKQALRYVLSDAFIYAVQTVAGHGSQAPAEEITFSYASLTIQYLAPSRHGLSQVKTRVRLP